MPLNIYLVVVFKQLITKTFSSILICSHNGPSLSAIVDVPGGGGYTLLTGVVQNFTLQLTVFCGMAPTNL
jgi:hypothetical protein